MAKYKSNLKGLRSNAEMTLDQLADATGISKRTLITIDCEEGGNPSIDTVKRLMEYFKISFEELYPDK